MVQDSFGGVVSKEIVFPNPQHTIAAVQEQSIRDLGIKPEKSTPPDQIRQWVREWPSNLKMDPTALMRQPPAKP